MSRRVYDFCSNLRLDEFHLRIFDKGYGGRLVKVDILRVQRGMTVDVRFADCLIGEQDNVPVHGY